MTTNEVIRNIERNFAILEAGRDAGFQLTTSQTEKLSKIANRIATWNVNTQLPRMGTDDLLQQGDVTEEAPDES